MNWQEYPEELPLEDQFYHVKSSLNGILDGIIKARHADGLWFSYDAHKELRSVTHFRPGEIGREVKV